MPFVVEKDFSYQCFIKREGNEDDLRIMQFKKNGRAVGKTASHAPPPVPCQVPCVPGLTPYTPSPTEPHADGGGGEGVDQVPSRRGTCPVWF